MRISVSHVVVSDVGSSGAEVNAVNKPEERELCYVMLSCVYASSMSMRCASCSGECAAEVDRHR